jgi:subtilisin-like proprotein convertase family protein
VNVVDLVGSHSWINDLIVKLKSPQGTEITLWSQICGNEDNFDVNFDDAATPGALPCPPVGGGTYRPANLLSAFNGENAQGTWTLTIDDVFNQDGGTLTSWGLEICLNSTITSVKETNLENIVSVYPNPVNNQLTVSGLTNDIVATLTITDITGKTVRNPTISSVNQQTIDVSNLSTGVYFLKISSALGTKTIKFVKER